MPPKPHSKAMVPQVSIKKPTPIECPNKHQFGMAYPYMKVNPTIAIEDIWLALRPPMAVDLNLATVRSADPIAHEQFWSETVLT